MAVRSGGYSASNFAGSANCHQGHETCRIASLFLSVGAGAIFQVVYSLGRWMIKSVHSNDSKLQNNGQSISNDVTTNPKPSLSSAPIIVGFIVGMIIMYITGLLI